MGARNSGVREDELKGSVVDSREVAGARRLVFFRAEGKRVDVDARIRVTGVVLERLNKVEVRSSIVRRVDGVSGHVVRRS